MTPRYNVAQLGARYRYLYAAALRKSGRLEKLFTDFWMPVAVDSRRFPSFFRKVAGRRNSLINNSQVISYYGLGLKLYRALSKSSDMYDQSEVLAGYGSCFAKRQLGRIDRSAGYMGMCSESLEVLQALKGHGAPTFLVQYDAADDSGILGEESEKWPAWSRDGNRRSPAYFDRVYREWDECGKIIVNSEWTRDHIIRQGADPGKIIQIPLIFDGRETIGPKQVNKTGPLNVLCVGAVVLRKGVQYLIEASKMLERDRFNFYLVGTNPQPSGAFTGVGPNVCFTGSLPYQEVARYYRQCDVLVFPSLSDGFGSVQVEAMNYGLPVIASTSCARVAEHEKSGLLVPPADPRAIADALQQLADDRDLLERLSRNAMLRSKRYSLPNITVEMIEKME